MHLFLRTLGVVALATVGGIGMGGLHADDGAPAEAPPAAEEPAEAEPVRPAKHARLAALREHVEWLTAPERMGRLAWDDRVACADYIAKQFADAGLVAPPGMETMLRDGEGKGAFEKVRNVCAWLPGASATDDSKKPGSYIIVSAHFDHLGARRGAPAEDGTPAPLELFAGADDNASGVAGMLELAHVLGKARADGGKPLAHSVLFVAFDLEEQQLIGSRRFAKEPPLPLDACWAFVTMDQLGRSLADLAPGSLFVQGAENAPAFHGLVDGVGVPQGGFVLPLGIDYQPGYSDYVPFKERSIPYLFVTSGACSSWHKLSDTADRIEWPHITARTDWCIALVRALASMGDRPTWQDDPKYHPKELWHLHGGLERISASVQKNPNLPPNVKFALTNFKATLKQMIADGEVTPEERKQASSTARMLFQFAMRLAGG